MSKNSFLMAAIAAVAAIVTGCSNEDNMVENAQPAEARTVILRGTVNAKGSNANTRSVDVDGKTAWKAGEKIAVYYQKSGGSWDTAEATVGTPNGDGSAPITATLTDAQACTVKLVYPASLANATGDIDNSKLLNNQLGTITDISTNFDAATGTAAITVSDSEATIPNFSLANQLCIVKFTLQDAGGTALSTTKFVIKAGSDTYRVIPGSATSEIAVAMLPAASAFTFIATTAGGDYTKSVSSATLAASKIYTQTLKLAAAPAQLNGQFTINNNDGKVYFSKGNLQATYDGTSWTWAFAGIQWDYVGNAAANTSINGNGTMSGKGTVDLFGWVGNSSTTLTSAPAKYGISNSTTYSDYGTTNGESLKSDWGNLAITNGGSGWRTLSYVEWAYLVNTRSASTVNGTPNARYCKATVNGTLGLVIFPDSYTHPDGVSAPTSINNSSGAFNSNTWTADNWTAMEAAGAVYLPAAGYRQGSDVQDVTKGCYWSKTSFNSNAYNIYFSDDGMQYGNWRSRFLGCSVRLVKNVQ